MSTEAFRKYPFSKLADLEKHIGFKDVVYSNFLAEDVQFDFENIHDYINDLSTALV